VTRALQTAELEAQLSQPCWSSFDEQEWIFERAHPSERSAPGDAVRGGARSTVLDPELRRRLLHRIAKHVWSPFNAKRWQFGLAAVDAGCRRLLHASARWVKSSFEHTTGGVEVRLLAQTVQMRDAKIGSAVAHYLSLSLDEWRAFLANAKAGEFDLSRLAAQAT
jgi:hypothetical protein